MVNEQNVGGIKQMISICILENGATLANVAKVIGSKTSSVTVEGAFNIKSKFIWLV